MSSNSMLDEENEYVRELHRLFLNCDSQGAGRLNDVGLSNLVASLHLEAISGYIVAKVLHDAKDVDFETFKDRFIQLIPEFLDSPAINDNAAVRSDDRELEHVARDLGLAANGFLTRYEAGVLCEHVTRFARLSKSHVNAIFDKTDPFNTGRVALAAFARAIDDEHRKGLRTASARNDVIGVTGSHESSCDFFESLDPAGTGIVHSKTLLEHWLKAGLRVDDGVAALQALGQATNGPVSTVLVSRGLEQELRAVVESSVIGKAALLSLHAHIEHLRWAALDNANEASHLQKQVLLGNQRRIALIEELEHNQASIEQSCETRIKESEERYRARVRLLEERQITEKRELQAELESCEVELSRVRQAELAARGRCALLERQATRAAADAADAAQTIAQIEQVNRQLRLELGKSDGRGDGGSSGGSLLWKHRVELLAAHNKRLREKVDDLTGNSNKTIATRKTKSSLLTGHASSSQNAVSHWSPAFRSHLLLLRRRRQARGDTLSEMESEPESIFVRAKRRKLVKIRDRHRRHCRISAIRESIMSKTSTSTSEESGKTLAERERAINDALQEQRIRLTEQFESERRQMQARMSAERADTERRSAMQKMSIVQQLQMEYDDELKRIASHSSCSAHCDELKKQIKLLESSLEGQRNGYERKMAEMRRGYEMEIIARRRRLRATSATAVPPVDESCADFIKLVETFKNADCEMGGAKLREDDANRFVPSDATHCMRCELMEKRLMELHHIVIGDVTLAESGIEDLGSSADSQHEEAAQLKSENARLKKRLERSREFVAELRVSLAGAPVPSTVSSSNAVVQDAPVEANRLLLQARLEHSQSLVRQLAGQYRGQLLETSRIGRLLQKIMSTLHYS